MKRYLNIKLFFLASFLVLLSSCESFVEVDLPKSQLTNTTVFEDYLTASAALTEIYSKIRDAGLFCGKDGLSFYLGNYTDENVSYAGSTTLAAEFYQNRLLATNTYIQQSAWSYSYNLIYAANALIEGVQRSSNLSEANKKQLQGEALFVRALVYFYLVNLFGDIPYIKETDYRKNSTVSRMTIQKVYENLISDLKNSIDMLPATYTPTNRTRPNSYTSHALLARVYLYNGQYTEASNEASTILGQTTIFSMEQDLNRVFLIGSKGTIWQLQSSSASTNTLEGGLFIFTATPPPYIALSNNLVNSFAAGDLRKSNWIKTVTNGSASWYHAYKYKQQTNTAASVEYSNMFRLEEQYLIRAEARAQLNNLDGAKEDLNKIRERAFGSGLGQTTAQTKVEILNAILQERRWEFFSELGHRFFDLKRFGKLDEVLSPLKPGWNSTDQLFPIPQTELSINPNLKPQNPGY